MPAEMVLITGASSGIGLELAKCFASEGSNLILVARREKELRALADELEQAHGIAARVLVKDLAQPAAPREIFEQLQQDNIEVDVLVNNAGFGSLGLFAELEHQRQHDIVQVNVMALTDLTRLFLPDMIERRRGGILNVASTAAFQAGPRMAIYFATKAFVLSLTEALSEELRGSGVKVSCLCPGPTETGFGPDSGMDESLLFRLGTFEASAIARAGYRGLRRNKTIVIPGLFTKLGAYSAKVFPRAWVRRVVKKLQ